MKGMMIPMVMTMILNLIYTVLAFLLGVMMLKLMDVHVFKKVDFEEEIKKGNMAVAVLVAAILLFIAIVVSAGLKG
jgi:uncharacterized membrane protein YjfL (UPF0719 family)